MTKVNGVNQIEEEEREREIEPEKGAYFVIGRNHTCMYSNRQNV